GLGSGVFFRTVKLKDFPWNGWLRVATATRPAAAWNPVAGFTDEAGALVWSVLGDAAVLPEPYGVGWLADRVRTAEVSGPVEVPRDALAPEPSTGELRAPAPGTVAHQRVTCRVALSKFHDETKMTVADLVYPYLFVQRWSTTNPQVNRTTVLLREWLAAVRVVKLDTEVRDFGDLQVFLETPVIEVYLRHAAEPAEAPAIAPPWSAVPWQLVVLTEEAFTSGPYRLQKWSGDSTVLTVFRDLSYPNVVGSFDGWALPRRAWVAAVDRRGDRLELQVDAQTLTKFERSYKIVREPMRLEPTGE